jgi:hypothetical protein
MPGRLAFDEAMLAAANRLRIADPELKGGRVERYSSKTAAGLIERPWAGVGGFAFVYKFRTRSGRFRALRCFHAHMEPDTEERYRHIEAYFNSHPPLKAITAGFRYHREGIRVEENGRAEVCPIIEMDWIEGRTLAEAVEEHARAGRKVELAALTQRWLEVLRILREAHMAHGDLSGSNVLVRDDGQLVLVDYDGVYIPPLRGFPAVVAGQPDYQHPQCKQRPFNEEMDAFSALVITLALMALAQQPSLWQQFADHTSRGGGQAEPRLLFKEADFEDPQRSPLFAALERMPDEQIRALTRHLREACRLPINRVSFPWDLVDPEYRPRQALVALERAIASDNDERILKCWLPLLDSYPPAQQHRQRVELAQQRLAALHRFRECCQKGPLAAVVAGYDAILNGCKAVTHRERRLLKLARRFEQGQANKDDERIVEVGEALLREFGERLFSAQERRILEEARRRLEVRRRWAEAWAQRNPRQLVAVGAAMRTCGLALSATEQAQVTLAERFMQLVAGDDDGALLALYQQCQAAPPAEHWQLDEQLRARIALAERRQEALKRLRLALQQRSLRQVGEAFEQLGPGYPGLLPHECRLAELARSFLKAWEEQNDTELIALGEQLQKSFVLTPEEEQALSLARRRQQGYQALLAALKLGRPQQILAAYDPLLEPRLTAEQRERLRLAREFLQVYGDERELATFYEKYRRSSDYGRLTFTAEEEQRIRQTCENEQRWQTFVEALETAARQEGEAGPQQVLAAYDALTPALQSRLTEAERAQVELARRALLFRQQCGTDLNPERLLRHYEPALLQRFPRLLDEEQRPWLEDIEKLSSLSAAHRRQDYRQVLLQARSISRPALLAGQRLRLQLAIKRLLENQAPEDVQALLLADGRQGQRLLVRWRWPEEPLISYLFLFWDTQRTPTVPRQILGEQVGTIAHYKIVMRGHLEESETGEVQLPIGFASAVSLVLCAALHDGWYRPKEEGEQWFLGPPVIRRLALNAGAIVSL